MRSLLAIATSVLFLSLGSYAVQAREPYEWEKKPIYPWQMSVSDLKREADSRRYQEQEAIRRAQEHRRQEREAIKRAQEQRDIMRRWEEHRRQEEEAAFRARQHDWHEHHRSYYGH